MIREPQNLKFTREDWQSLTNPERLQQRTGVAGKDRLIGLAIKELVDNALDATSDCKVGITSDGGCYVEDAGSGFDAQDLPHIFCVNRPMETTKLWRNPTRGALGNGLRVVTGTILSFGGSLTVYTRNQECQLFPNPDDGSTHMETMPCDWPRGAKIVLSFPGISLGTKHLYWAYLCMMLNPGTYFKGGSSPHWYSVDAWHELFRAAGNTTVRELLTSFDGCTGGKAGDIAGDFLKRSASSLTRDEAEQLLKEARRQTTPVKPARLGFVGEIDGFAYAKHTVDFQYRNGLGPELSIPFVVETWARPARDDDSIGFCVNRSPVVAPIDIQRLKKPKQIGLFGCNLKFGCQATAFPIQIFVNVICPFIPTTSESKAPDLEGLWEPGIKDTIEKVARKLSSGSGQAGLRDTRGTIKDCVIDALPEAMNVVSGNNQCVYSQRQLFYKIRPKVMKELQQELLWDNFTQIITNYECELGKDLPKMYRDIRGSIYHPHTGKIISLGTIQVENYNRPKWIFNKFLFNEKEGFNEILIAAKWPEKHDCVLVSSKGFATRAARDLIDLLGETDEPIEFFCIHDADGHGTLIYQALAEATKARPARAVKVINLGLELDEAIEMGLEIESITPKNPVRVADYVSAELAEKYQHHRCELNAMTSPQLLEWLNKKFEQHSTGRKVVPPHPVIATTLSTTVQERVEQILTDSILRAAQLDRQIDEIMEKASPRIDRHTDELVQTMPRRLSDSPASLWSTVVEEAADTLVESLPGLSGSGLV